MKTFFIFTLMATLILTVMMLIRLFAHENIYNRYAGILVMSTNIIPILLLVGVIEERLDMYVDIAISYALLGLITSIILAKFMGNRKDGEEDDNGA